MAEETGNLDAAAGAEAAETTQDKVFTQADLDAIVKDRLSRERKKFADYDKYKAAYEAGLSEDEKIKASLAEAQARVAELEAEKTAREEEYAHKELVKKVMDEQGVDHSLVEFMTAKDEEGLTAQAQKLGSISSFSEPSRNERRKPSEAPRSAAEEFGDWLQENNFIF